MIKAAVLTLGCRVNQYESDYIIKELSKNGVTICDVKEKCDIYIINTCSVTAESDRKSRQFIRKCIKSNPDAIVIVTGCFSQINKDSAEKIEGVIIYRWNRKYPSDFNFPIGFLENMRLVSTENFVGNSHPEITEEIYSLWKRNWF